MTDSTKRFSDRVSHYIRSRPGYPQALLDFFRAKLHLLPSHRLADIGSGTGILSQLFLKNRNTVWGIEPNAEMRSAGESILRDEPHFHSVNGTAEATTLPDASVDFVTAGQAFHWFDPVRSARELRRILTPGGWIALVWNERRTILDGFNLAYDTFVAEHTSDSAVAKIRGGSVGADPAVQTFFGDAGFQTASFPNHQDLDWPGLLDRVYSSSYMPLPDDPRATAMTQQLRAIYDQFKQGEIVRIDYETRLFHGRIPAADRW